MTQEIKLGGRRNLIDWNLARKHYPEIIAEIQQWFCEMIGHQTKVWFYDQPVWRIEVLPAFFGKRHKLYIKYDIAWDKTNQQFKFVYAIMDGDRAVPPQQVFSERIQAEHFAYAHTLQYIKDKAAQVQEAEVVAEPVKTLEQFNQAIDGEVKDTGAEFRMKCDHIFHKKAGTGVLICTYCGKTEDEIDAEIIATL